MGNNESVTRHSDATQPKYVQGDSALVKALEERRKYGQPQIRVSDWSTTDRSRHSITNYDRNSAKYDTRSTFGSSKSMAKFETKLPTLPPLDFSRLNIPTENIEVSSFAYSEHGDDKMSHTTRNYRMRLKVDWSDRIDLSTTPEQHDPGKLVLFSE